MKEYLNSSFYINQKDNKIIKKYCLIILIIFTGVLGLLFTLNYEIIITNKAIVLKEDKYYLKIYVKEEDMYKYLCKPKLLIMNKIFSYKIKSISNDYVLDDKMNKYREVKVAINLDKKLAINNNVIEIRKLYKKTKIINIIISKIKGENL